MRPGALLSAAIGVAVGGGTASAGRVDGEIYDAVAGGAVAGVTVLLDYDAEDGLEPGQRVPADRLGAGQQGQVTGADGRYRFDVPAGRRYRLVIDPSRGSWSFPSRRIPPRPGFAVTDGGGRVVAADAPAPPDDPVADRSYYLRFDVPASDRDVLNDHVPLDPLAAVITLTKRADRAEAATGDLIHYTVTATNRSQRDFRASGGTGVYVVDAPARGLSYLTGQASARIAGSGGAVVLRAGTGFADAPQGSNRLIRFGPFDLPAGATLTLHYQVAVGLDTRPGHYDNRAALRDAGGVDLAAPTTATVRVVGDADLDTGVVLGRVFCDRDGDGRRGAGEPGVFGARVAATTGSYAISDSAGQYHLSGLPAGSHLIKLDEASLAGGRAAGDASELVRLTAGLSARVDFAVSCAAVEVGPGHPRMHLGGAGGAAGVTPPPPAPPVVHGDLSRFAVEVDGVAVTLPAATLAVAGDRNRPPVPPGGWTAPLELDAATSGGAVARWSVALWRVDPAGLVEVRTLAGDGAPPAAIPWDGRGGDGQPVAGDALYVAQLRVELAGGGEAASARLVFGVGFGAAPAPERLIWRGALFTGNAARPAATATLRRLVGELAARLGSGDTVVIESHADGSSDALSVLAGTQREADAAATLFRDAGVGADRITARGRGGLDPIDRGRGAQARQANRRLVVLVSRPPSANAGAAIPAGHAGAPSVLIDGKPVTVDEQGRFRVTARGPRVAIDLEAADGRRSAVELEVGAGGGAGRGGAAPSRGVPVAIDLDAGRIAVDGRPVAAELRALAVRPPAQVTLAGTPPAPTTPLVVGLTGPRLPLDWWRLEARCAGDWTEVAGGRGAPPATTTWDGKAAGVGLLRPGVACAIRLVAGTAGGAIGFSAAQPLPMAGPAAGWSDRSFGGRLFAGAELTSPFKNRLSQLFTELRSRPADERYRIDVEVAARRTASATDRQMRAAAGGGALTRYLRRLGLAAERFEVAAVPAAADKVVVHAIAVPAVAPAAAADRPRLLIDGAEQRFDGGKAEVTVPVSEGAAVVVDVTDGQGRRAVYVVAGATAAGGGGGGGGGALSTELRTGGEQETGLRLRHPAGASAQPERGREATGDGRLTGITADAGVVRFRVMLPPEGTVIGADEVAVTGRGAPGTRVRVRGSEARQVRIGEDGRFAVLVPVAGGVDRLAVEAVDGDGNTASLEWPIGVADRQLFAVGLVEGIAAAAWTSRGWLADAAWLDGMTERSAITAGPLVLHGRAVAYLKARLRDTPLGDVALTSHLDTARPAGSGAFFTDLLDGRGQPPVWGDSAAEVRDANTRGNFYLRLESKPLRAVVGSLHTDLGGGHLFGYQRTVDGGRVDIDTERVGHRLTGRGFATGDLAGLARGRDWFRATGGSLYYLRHRMLVEGSEQVRAVVRERDSGLVIADRVLVRDRDYTIDWTGGRILLVEPLASTAASGWVVHDLDASATPLDGDPVYLEVDYEHQDASAGQRAAGAEVRDQWRGISVGAGAVGEGRPGRADYLHWGIDASARSARGSRVAIELAGSRAGDGADQMSSDGGLTFLDLDHLAGPVESRGAGAVRVSAEVAAADLLGDRLGARTHASLLVQDVDRDFSGGGALLEQGRLVAVGLISHQLDDRDRLTLRHVAEVAELPRVGPTAADVAANPDPLALDERATYLTTLQWAGVRGRWDLRAELMHQRLTTTAVLADGGPQIDGDRLGLGAAAGWRYSRRLLLRGSQQVIAGRGGADPVLDPLGADGRSSDFAAGVTTGVGAEVALTSDLAVTGDWFQRWDGDNAAQLGLRSALSDTGSMYVRQRAGARDGRLVATTVIGAEDRLGTTGGRSYGEYQIENGALGQRNRAVLGLGHRWTAADGVRVSAGLEHQQLFGGFLPDGTAVGNLGRDVVHAAVELTRFDRLRAGAQVELRWDHGPPPASGDDLAITSDPRPEAGADAFADHGGVAPGAPLVLARGDVFQVVAAAGAAWRLDRGLTVLGRSRVSQTERDDPDGATLARWRELTAGLAWRPVDDDWLDVLARYSWLRGQRPPGDAGPTLDENAHVVAILPLADLPHRVTVAGKLAWKRSQAATTLLEGDRRVASVDAVLWLARLAYRFHGRWDAAIEVRQLWLDLPAASQTRWGLLGEVGYRVNRLLRLGAGYDLSRFSDDELGDLQRDGHGFFVRVTGQY